MLRISAVRTGSSRTPLNPRSARLRAWHDGDRPHDWVTHGRFVVALFRGARWRHFPLAGQGSVSTMGCALDEVVGGHCERPRRYRPDERAHPHRVCPRPPGAVPGLILDLTCLEFFGAAGFSALHRISVSCARAGLDWALVPGAAVSLLLRICDPDGWLPVVNTVGAAVARFQGSASDADHPEAAQETPRRQV